MRLSARGVIAASLFFLSGCTPYYDSYHYGGDSSGPYADARLEELLRFGADLANRSASSRAETCRSLLKRNQANPTVGIKLHLMMGRTLSDSCGDISRIVSSVASIPPRNLPDDRVQMLIEIQTETLKRLASTPRRAGDADKKGGGGQDSPKDEARLLREKLEAIRSLEKKLDESGGAN